jgi:hypothetical protein
VVSDDDPGMAAAGSSPPANAFLRGSIVAANAATLTAAAAFSQSPAELPAEGSTADDLFQLLKQFGAAQQFDGS